jgi:hypothetical protein
MAAESKREAKWRLERARGFDTERSDVPNSEFSRRLKSELKPATLWVDVGKHGDLV